MPLVDTTVGPLPLPAPAGTAQAPLVDETVARLIDYCAFWLNDQLNAKIATMTSPSVPKAVPVTTLGASPTNVYANPPDALYLKRKLPALFIWWNGNSKSQWFSTVRRSRVRTLSLLYVFERVKNVDNEAVWAGLTATCDAIMHRAFDRRSHPNYTYPTSGFGPGTDIRIMNNWLDVEYNGGSPGFLKETAGESMRQIAGSSGNQRKLNAQGGIQAMYPALSATITVEEEVGTDTNFDPTDVLHDVGVTISAAEGQDDAEPFLERILHEPDGSGEDTETP